jgi:hypothetical protein
MAKKNTVKCMGCGCEVWVGAKIIDGYCHDCYARGRHLPPIVEDPPYQPPQPKPKPRPIPLPTLHTPTAPEPLRRFWRKFFRETRRGLRWLIILLAIVGLGASIYIAVPALIDRFSQSTDDSSTINTLRDMHYSDFINQGERISDESLPDNAAAIAAFMGSGISYRMDGIFEYAYYDYTDNGQLKKHRTEVEMSYNGDMDVYKFAISGSGDISEELTDLGTYYVVKENGMIHILHHGDGRRSVIGINEGMAIYEFLMQYCMEIIVGTDLITDSNITARQYREGDFYSLSHSDVDDGSTVYGGQHRTELRTYQNQPLSWYDCNRDIETWLEWQITANFYYDNIPDDAPSVADWK